MNEEFRIHFGPQIRWSGQDDGVAMDRESGAEERRYRRKINRIMRLIRREVSVRIREDKPFVGMGPMIAPTPAPKEEVKE
jgi:hypothetical protein